MCEGIITFNSIPRTVPTVPSVETGTVASQSRVYHHIRFTENKMCMFSYVRLPIRSTPSNKNRDQRKMVCLFHYFSLAVVS
jgi:hypothetical protein